MIIEYAQLLCSAHWMTGNEAPYRKTHVNHPCSVWTRTSIQNYNWLLLLGKELCKEYTYRYRKRHKTQDVFNWLEENVPTLPSIGLSEHFLAMPDKYKSDSVVKSYRNYYLGDKKELLNYKIRKIPDWVSESISGN